MWESFWFEFINFYFIPGLVLGCIYALGAIGITLTFGILRFANFSHGEIMMTSSYLTWESMVISASLVCYGFFKFLSVIRVLSGFTVHRGTASLGGLSMLVFDHLPAHKYCHSIFMLLPWVNLS